MDNYDFILSFEKDKGIFKYMIGNIEDIKKYSEVMLFNEFVRRLKNNGMESEHINSMLNDIKTMYYKVSNKNITTFDLFDDSYYIVII